MDFSSLINYLNKCEVKYQTNVNTASIVSIKVGGIASVVIYPNTIEQLCNLLNFIHSKYKYYLIGKGTNVYFCDFFDGVIISTKYLNRIKLIDNDMEAECGASLTRCAVYAYDNSLTGLEFTYGIPGTVGGGVYMNASAYGGQISDVVRECLVYDTEKKDTYILKNEYMDFSSKHSAFMNRKYIILTATLHLLKGDNIEIKSKMDTYMQNRINTQPLNIPSAGSAFKRPIGYYASRLIDEAGLKGYKIGDAQISKKHAGFIINKGSASAKDINDLIRYVKKEIKTKFNVDLEEEIIYLE